jgi:hypothetical protein
MQALASPPRWRRHSANIAIDVGGKAKTSAFCKYFAFDPKLTFRQRAGCSLPIYASALVG